VIVVMKPNATEDEVQKVVRRAEEAGLRGVPVPGEGRTTIAILGDTRSMVIDRWLAAPGVERILPIMSRYKLASREVHPDPTRIPLNGDVIGAGRIAVIAGPCAVEGLEQVLEAARWVKAAGAIALRGGAYKPRTSPYSFRGLEEEGLKILAEARKATGLPIVTEVLSAAHVEKVSEYADVLQVGARNMQNYILLRALGEAPKPVLLKRGMGATVEELLLAAEHVMASGNPNVMLCCRGIRTFEDHVRYTLSLGTVAYLKQVTHLPVLVDPSHAAGDRSLVPPLCMAAVACGADGLLVEVHPDPENALVDGPQSLTCGDFDALMAQLRPLAEAVGRSLGRADRAEPAPARTSAGRASGVSPGA